MSAALSPVKQVKAALQAAREMPQTLAKHAIACAMDNAGKNGAGIQLVAARGADARLLAYAATLGETLANEGSADHACSS